MSDTEDIPYLSENTLAGLGITTGDVIASVEKLIAGNAEGSVWSAPKAVLMPPDGRYMMAALAAADDPPLLAVKTVVLNPRNSARGLPQINGLVTMLDSSTGLPAAIVDGNWITAVRTAGMSATAARRLARPESSVAAFIGCGVQAKSHLQAFSELYPLREIRLFGRGQANIDTLCEAAEALSLTAVVCASGRDTVAGAYLVVSSVTLTGQPAPFMDANWLEPGAFAAITDLGVPWIKAQLSAFDRIVIDDRAQEAAMVDKLVPPDLVCGDLSELVLGQVGGRGHGDERAAFIFRGHALGDLALAGLALQRYRARRDA